jgi:hypothetical protein
MIPLAPSDVPCCNSTDRIDREIAMSLNQPTISNLRKVVEGRDSAGLKALYANDAVLTIVDTINSPSKPRIIKGATDIGAT